MSLTQRRLLFYCFILLFLIIVPIVLMYATGRTINWERFEFQKTATLVVDSQPEAANVFLNGRPPLAFVDRLFNRSENVTTKTKLTGLLPGTYTLRLELGGYLSWEEQITLRPGEVFNTDTIRLFAQAKPELLAELPLEAVAAPDGQTLAAVNKAALTIYQVTENRRLTVELPAEPKNTELLWSADGERLLVGRDMIVGRDGRIIIDVQTALSEATLVRWDQDTAALFLLSENRLYRFDPLTNVMQPLQDLSVFGAISDLQVRSGRAFLVAQTGGRTELVILSENDLENDSRTQLKSGMYRFIQAGRDVPVLLDETRHDVYLIERPLPFIFTYRLTLVSQDYRLGYWSGDELMYATPFELRRWREDEPELLLARWSEPVTDVRRLPNGEQVLFATPTAIQILPSDEQAFRPAVRLADMEMISSFTTVENNAVLFLGTANGVSGLYRLAF